MLLNPYTSLVNIFVGFVKTTIACTGYFVPEKTSSRARVTEKVESTVKRG